MKPYRAVEVYEFLRKFGHDIYLVGDTEIEIKGVSSLENYKNDSLTWIKPGHNIDVEQGIRALVLSQGTNKTADVMFYCDNPKFYFFKAAEFLMDTKREPVISSTAIIAKSAKLGDFVSIGHYSFIGENVVIGDNTQIGSHVTIEGNVKIGDNCCIKSGAVIGGRGFGYSKVDGQYLPVSHFGGVIIGDYVDVGSNTCIDRGTLDDTIIENGVKIDNLCHIAHNVLIKENSCIVANSTIGGSAKIDQGSYIGISASIQNQKSIGEESLVGMGAVVTKDVPKGKVVAFSPAKVIRERTKNDLKKY